jgi:hypothetical protein
VNVARATDAVFLAFQRGARVLDRRSAEALVRLVATALGDGHEVQSPEGNVESSQDIADDEQWLALDIRKP